MNRKIYNYLSTIALLFISNIFAYFIEFLTYEYWEYMNEEIAFVLKCLLGILFAGLIIAIYIIKKELSVRVTMLTTYLLLFVLIIPQLIAYWLNWESWITVIINACTSISLYFPLNSFETLPCFDAIWWIVAVLLPLAQPLAIGGAYILTKKIDKGLKK